MHVMGQEGKQLSNPFNLIEVSISKPHLVKSTVKLSFCLLACWLAYLLDASLIWLKAT